MANHASDILYGIPCSRVFSDTITEAYSALFEDVASTAAHRTKNVIRNLFPQLSGKWDEVAADEAGRPILTMRGKNQTYIEYFERAIRNYFFHDGANQKFEPGIARIAYGELKMENRGQESGKLSSLKHILKLISDGHANEYDADLNGLTYEELDSRFGLAVQKADERLRDELSSAEYGHSDYVIEEIPDFETAKKFYRYTNPDSPWCITHIEDMWDSYTSFGLNRVYFAYLPDFKETERIKGEDSPRDKYGLSLISIIVDPWSHLRAVTTRWNHVNGGTDQSLDARNLSKLLGGNVFELCPPGEKPERRIERIDADSVKIGDQIWMCHNLQMPADEANGIYVHDGETYFTWHAALRVAEDYGGGWRLPSMKDWRRLADFCGGENKAAPYLKSNTGWEGKYNRGENGFDTYGFNGTPAGWYSSIDDRFYYADEVAIYWTSGSADWRDAYAMQLPSYTCLFSEYERRKRHGMSVRLVKDA